MKTRSARNAAAWFGSEKQTPQDGEVGLETV